MTTETINGLHKCQPKNMPVEGEVKNMVVLHMPAKPEQGKKAWISIKSAPKEKGGSPYRILAVTDTGWEPDTYGNLAFNIEVEPATEQSSDFQKARETMQQGRKPEEPKSYPGDGIYEQGDDGVSATRKHLMQSANLLVLCIKAADKAIAPNVPPIAQTTEFFLATVGKLYIEASGRRSDDNVTWWSYIDKMPTHPIKPNGN